MALYLWNVFNSARWMLSCIRIILSILFAQKEKSVYFSSFFLQKMLCLLYGNHGGDDTTAFIDGGCYWIHLRNIEHCFFCRTFIYFFLFLFDLFYQIADYLCSPTEDNIIHEQTSIEQVQSWLCSNFTVSGLGLSFSCRTIFKCLFLIRVIFVSNSMCSNWIPIRMKIL